MKNNKKTKNGNQKLEKLLMIFMIMQPFLDIYYLYTDKIISIFKLSPATIIRMVVMGLLLLFSFLKNKDKNKVKWLIAFILVYTTYTIFHHINATSFSKEYSIYHNYNIIKELFYIIRMFMPLAMIFITKEINLSENKVKKIIYTIINIFSITIIVTNIAKISLTSYADGNKIIVANIFDWFSKGIYERYGYELIASKGFFHMANQISATLIALLPIEIYYILKEKMTKFKIITLGLNILALLMIGTRVASYGWIIAIILIVIEYIFINLKQKSKIDIIKILTLGIITGIFCLILPYSPVSNRTYASDEAAIVAEHIKESGGEEERKTICQNSNIEKCKEEKIQYIERFYGIYGFDKLYIEENYPYTDDPEFWFNSFSIPYIERANHRQLKTMITKRIIELNNNNNDYLWGLSFTRLRNTYVYMENDIYVHLYSIGIFGIILFILPYALVCLYVLYKMIKNKKLSFINIVYLTSVGIVFLAGMVSGNVFDEWIVTLFLGFICGLLLKNTEIKE